MSALFYEYYPHAEDDRWPICPANTYDKPERWQELCWDDGDRWRYPEIAEHPRRPVLMRGAMRHLRETGWMHPQRLAKRYLALIRYTCFDRGEHVAFCYQLEDRVARRYRARGWRRGVISAGRCLKDDALDLMVGECRDGTIRAWIAGHYEQLPPERYKVVRVFANATKAIEAEEKKSEPKVWPPGSEWRQPKHMRAPQTVKENGT